MGLWPLTPKSTGCFKGTQVDFQKLAFFYGKLRNARGVRWRTVNHGLCRYECGSSKNFKMLPVWKLSTYYWEHKVYQLKDLFLKKKKMYSWGVLNLQQIFDQWAFKRGHFANPYQGFQRHALKLPKKIAKSERESNIFLCQKCG